MSDKSIVFASAQVEILSAKDAASLPTFKMVGYTGAAMNVGFGAPVVVDLSTLKAASQSIPVRFHHDAGRGVGHTDSIEITDKRVTATGVISRDTPEAREIVVSSARGFPWQASIGASIGKMEFVAEEKSVEVNGKTFKGPIYVMRKGVLFELSFVDLGADGRTSATVAAEFSEEDGDMPDEKKTDAKTVVTVDAAKQTDNQVTVHVDIDPVSSMRAKAAAEVERIEAVRKVTDKNPEIQAKAIAEGWTADQAELAVLRATRPTAPAVGASRSAGITSKILECACVMASKLDGHEKQYDAPTLEAAHERFRGRLGLQELLLEAAWANGYTGRNSRDLREVMRFAFGKHIEAGFSAVDISGILSNVANKFLIAGFMSVESTWRRICSIRPVTDFKTVTSYRLIGTEQYQLVPPGGELKHGDLGEESYTNKADTYGLILVIDRTAIINDDLGAISTVPQKLGRGSGLKINDVFWTAFMDNSTFFATGYNNYLDGSTTALGCDSLSTAEYTFMDMTDTDGKPTGINPAILLVPTALSAMANVLFKSMELRDTTASTKFPTANPHMGKFRPEVSRYLGNSAYTGYSAKAWYLLADPNDLSAIEVAFLNGQESPTIETADADFSVLGVQMRGYHDFGVAKQDPRAGLKMKGEA